MSSIMGALETWMSLNRLRLKSAKTQFFWLGTRQQLARLDMVALAAAFPFSLSPLLCVTWASHWTESSHLLPISTCLAVTVSTNCASFALSPAHSLLLLPPLLSMPFVTTRLDYCCSLYAGLLAVRLGAWIGSCVLLPALSAAYQNLAMSLDSCATFSTGSPLSSGLRTG